jgi:multicomponent Na+:H+ antiporter subunit G
VKDLFVAALLLIGALFSLVASVGLLRFPDLLTRMQAATKSGTLGVGCTLIAVAVHFSEVGITTRALLVVGFLFLTAPVAAHMIGRAGYFVGVSLWSGTVHDELRDRYDRKAKTLSSEPDGHAPQPPVPDTSVQGATHPGG